MTHSRPHDCLSGAQRRGWPRTHHPLPRGSGTKHIIWGVLCVVCAVNQAHCCDLIYGQASRKIRRRESASCGSNLQLLCRTQQAFQFEPAYIKNNSTLIQCCCLTALIREKGAENTQKRRGRKLAGHHEKLHGTGDHLMQWFSHFLCQQRVNPQGKPVSVQNGPDSIIITQ